MFVFTDETGCFTFERKQNVSTYFILCTISTKSCDMAHDLLALRRSLAWEGYELGDFFHASTDAQLVRDQVFETITQHPFRVQATIMEKSKAQPHVRISKARFYQFAYFYHFKFGVRPLIPTCSEVLVTTASLGNKKERIAFQSAVDDVMNQTSPTSEWRTDFMPCQADPCLQVADYCAWAIQRKWERNDSRSYDLIADRITYEYDLWSHGNVHYY
jgi:hypothetical protein